MIEHNVVSVEADYVVVEITLDGQDEGIKLGLPRPKFSDNMLSTMAIALGDVRFKDAARNACEDLFIESWVRHCRSRVNYWSGWWARNAPSHVPFPLSVVIGTFIPKCNAMGTNSELKDALRKAIADARSSDEDGNEEV